MSAAWQGKEVAVVGLGVSNLALTRFLVRAGARVTVFDRKPAAELKERLLGLEGLEVRAVLGPSYLDGLRQGFHTVFLTPGIPKGLPEIREAQSRGAVLSGEIPLFLEMTRARVIGVTGSAGKTTTTTLISLILSASGIPAHLGGNIGQPLIERVDEIGSDEWVVLELSSFQLQLTRHSPHIGVLLNLRPDHLDVHTSLEEYREAKTNIYRWQKPGDWAVLNAAEPWVAEQASRVPGRVAWFGEDISSVVGAGVSRDGSGTWIVMRCPDGEEKRVCEVEKLRLVGRHNLQNALAAVTASCLAGATPKAAARVLSEFPGVEHRLERVAEIGGVTYVNDSIATTPDRTLAAIRALPGRLVLIAGGYDKRLPFEGLAREMPGKVRHLVLLGATAPRIRAAVESLSAAPVPGASPAAGDWPEIHEVADLPQGVQVAASLARPGDTVVLSPACASFDMFRNYAERGRMFKQLVRDLPVRDPQVESGAGR